MSRGRLRQRAWASRSELALFGAIFAGVWLLWDTTFIYPLKVLVVLMHELGHGLAAIATGGSIERIEINANQGGVCYTYGGNRFLVLSAGYLGSMAMGAAILLTAARTQRGDKALATALGILLIAITLLYIRPFLAFGFLFGLGAGAAMTFMGATLPNSVSDVALKVIGTTSCLYAILDIKSDVLDRPGVESDAVMLAGLTHVPALVWGVVWIVIAGLVTLVVFALAASGSSGRRGARTL